MASALPNTPTNCTTCVCDTIDVDTVSDLIATVINENPGSIDAVLIGIGSVTALRALTQLSSSKIAALLGSTTPGDGGGGLYYYDTLSTDDDDGIATIKPDSVSALSPGRWKKFM